MRRSLIARALAIAAAASLALTGCGREASSDKGPGSSTAIDSSKASGTINVWAMGTEGEKLQDFVKDFETANALRLAGGLQDGAELAPEYCLHFIHDLGVGTFHERDALGDVGGHLRVQAGKHLGSFVGLKERGE